ncbi:MAG: hypothetical protein ABW133_00550 [Polyangiaceae bacterium]
MNASLISGITMAGLLLAPVALAEKDEKEAAPVTYKAPNRAFEIQSGSAFVQGFGGISKNREAGLRDLGKGSLSGQLGLGYRLDPKWMIGVYGEFGRYGRGDSVASSSKVYGAAAGVQAQYHLLPFDQVDPWIGLGTGWRGYWVNDEQRGTQAMHGWDMLRVQLGVDWHATEWLSLVPNAGATMTMFLTEQGVGETSFSSVTDPRLNTFVFAGIGGRFDIGGRVSKEPGEVASR